MAVCINFKPNSSDAIAKTIMCAMHGKCRSHLGKTKATQLNQMLEANICMLYLTQNSSPVLVVAKKLQHELKTVSS